MKIALDCMGGDNSPGANVKGAIDALNEIPDTIYLFGKKELIEAEMNKFKYDKERLIVVDCTETINPEDHPVEAIRKKKDSSMVKAITSVFDKTCDAIISSGNTGALLVGSLLILKRIEGVDRPAVAPLLPSKTTPFVLIDGGTNADVRPKNLLQFGIMGSILMENIEGISTPRVGIANIGIEKEKGNELAKAGYELLEESNLNFVGNIEGNEILNGKTDVLVTDGFTGNIILKLIEGNTKTIFSLIKEGIKNGGILTKIGGMLLKPFFNEFKNRYDANKVGGAPIIGVNGISIKAHGSSNDEAFKNAIFLAKKFHEKEIIQKIKKNLENNL